MQLIVNFLKGLFDSNGNVSSKRFAGIQVLQVVIVMVLGSQFTKYKLDYAVLITLIGFVLGCFGMNTVLSAKSMQIKETVAKDIVDGNKPGANEDAKDVLASDKP